VPLALAVALLPFLGYLKLPDLQPWLPEAMEKLYD